MTQKKEGATPIAPDTLRAEQNNVEVPEKLFTAGTTDDPKSNAPETLYHCLTCLGLRFVQYSEIGWTDVEGTLHTGHQIESGKIKPRKLTVQEIKRHKNGPFMPSPTLGVAYTTEAELFNYIRAFIKKHVELPADIYYDVTTLFAMATWRVEHAATATYLNPLAAHGNGKSTLDEILLWICYKSIHSEGATRGAIVRVCDGTKATLILDEADNWLNPRDYDNPLAAVLNAGYRKRIIGGVMICQQEADGKYGTIVLDSFGFKVISGRNPLNQVLASRCITIRMRKSNRRFPKVNYAEAWLLRQYLLTYQQTHGEEPLEHESANRIGDGRLREIFEPLLAAAPNDEIRDHLVTFANEEKERRDRQELSSDEATVARTVLELAKDAIARNEPRTTVYIKEISDTINLKVTNPKEQIDPRYVSKLLTRHGFISEHKRLGSAIRLEPELMQYLQERYDPADPQTALQP
jgi:hypothetical protein